MELYLLDWNYEKTQVIDSFESLIWTERYSSHGDFTLNMEYNRFALSNLQNNYGLAFSESNRVMMIENLDVPNRGDNEGKMTITGRSFEAFLENRNSKRLNSTVSGEPEYYQGAAGDIARYIVSKFCVDPSLAGAVNVIPKLKVDVGAPPTPQIGAQMQRDNVYNMVKAICDSADIGFMIYRTNNPTELRFQVYQGIDKSDPNGSVYQVFSQDLGTLTNEAYMASSAGYKNHARVLSARGGLDVYAPGTPSTVSGMDRRTLVVEASDIGTDPEVPIAEDAPLLKQRGLEALAESANKKNILIDGDVPPDMWNETHYGLGDIVRVRSSIGIGSVGSSQKMRITENIWTIDQTGERMYPTFQAI